MERWLGLPRLLSAHLGDSVIDLPVHGHAPCHRAHRAIRFAPQTPKPEAARSGMTLWQGIPLNHPREPRLAYRGCRR
jgi:hypothetical protein